MSGLKFGTSGLRGLVTELGDSVCAAYATAFLQHMRAHHRSPGGGRVLVGYDLRSSSPRIAAACIRAARAFGSDVENCGPLPTPALALRALTLGMPAIMVTGSHIPADRNGLKFYRFDGEIDKADEAGILSFLELSDHATEMAAGAAPAITCDAIAAYALRCRGLLDADALKGMRIGVYQHSTVARDLIGEILLSAGAEIVPLARSEVFVPVDTEALRDEDVTLAEKACRELALDALVSADGDADRPLIADERGIFLRGDSVGLLTALFLGSDAVVTPVTSNTAVELSGYFGKVVRTKVGSPYVIEGMQAALGDGFKRVVGFEANGGVLLGSPLALDGRTIDALPTRDAMLPILSVLGMAAKEGVRLSALQRRFPQRHTRSGRIEHVPAPASARFLEGLMGAGVRADFMAEMGTVSGSDAIDGVRTILSNGDVIHFRASGNAPELRCYVETTSEEHSERLLAWGLKRAATALSSKGTPAA